jgi:CHAT domain-containing protein
VETLKKVRSNLVAISADVQFSFRDNVEPVYRQLVKLLLSTEDDNPSEDTLLLAVNLIDDLQLAELENFLSCDLSSIATNSSTINELGNAAFIYPIILEDRLHVIYQLPGQPLKYKANQVSRVEIEKTVNKLREAIARRIPEDVRSTSKQVYQWLIQPLEVYLEPNTPVDTLVFVLDGHLRNIPMAVLYDPQKQEYLVEKDYALAVLPTSQLFNLGQSSLQLEVLAAGISETLEVEERKFTAINAEAELAQIEKLVTAETLLNSEFTPASLQQQLRERDFSVLHLATHGNFSSDPQQTYILTYEQLLRANDLNNLLRNSNQAQNSTIDLLILSACQTALGDNRAKLRRIKHCIFTPD